LKIFGDNHRYIGGKYIIMKNDDTRYNFNGKIAVITGGANGIGLACAKEFLACGAETWILDLREEHPERVAKRIGANGITADVAQRETMEIAFKKIGTPDIVVANAGVILPSSFINTSYKDWRRTIDVNLTGVFNIVQIAASYMKDRLRGTIVINVSVNAWDGESDLLSYNASKAGLLGILNTAANELGPYQIRVNAVCPGLIHTRLSQPCFDEPEIAKEILKHTPLGRAGMPYEVAKVITFLASENASYMTGSILRVDGGAMSAKLGTWNENEGFFKDNRWQLNKKF
jgi:NAD(P)-dependent dehydrogenase (short-subunit alcohol dehydrogenase family)